MKVKDKLNQGNWYKGGWGTDAKGAKISPGSGSFCKMCLKTAAFIVDDMYSHKADKLRSVIKELFPDRLSKLCQCEIVSFNDHPDTTWEDVARVLEKADV